MRFFSGRQISFIFKNIINKKDSNILEFLRASFGTIFGNCSLTNFSYDLKEENVVKKYSENIDIVYNYIKKQFDFNKKNIENIFESNKINFKSLKSEKNLSNENDDLFEELYKGIYFNFT